MNRNAFAVNVCLMTAGVLFGHDLYIMPEKFQVTAGPVSVALHDGDAFPESEVPMVIPRLRDARLWLAGKASELTNPRVDGKRVLVDGRVSGEGTVLLSGRTIPNFIELQPKEFLAYLKEEGLNEVIEWRARNRAEGKPGRERYSKFFKSLVVSGKPDSGYKQVAGHVIEIVPEADPNVLKPGATLPVQVLFQGKPAADLQVELAWAGAGGHDVKVVGRTDAAGKAKVPLARSGKYRIHSLRMERCAEPQVADWESSWASLTFEIR